MVRVMLPEMGESVTEGSIVEWRRRVGEYVAEGDPLVEVTTDKVDVEVPATASGQITQILAREGDTVAVGTALAEIDTSKTDGAATARKPHRQRRTGATAETCARTRAARARRCDRRPARPAHGAAPRRRSLPRARLRTGGPDPALRRDRAGGRRAAPSGIASSRVT